MRVGRLMHGQLDLTLSSRRIWRMLTFLLKYWSLMSKVLAHLLRYLAPLLKIVAFALNFRHLCSQTPLPVRNVAHFQHNCYRCEGETHDTRLNASEVVNTGCVSVGERMKELVVRMTTRRMAECGLCKKAKGGQRIREWCHSRLSRDGWGAPGTKACYVKLGLFRKAESGLQH